MKNINNLAFTISRYFRECKKFIENDLGIEVTNAQTLGMVLNFYKHAREINGS